MLVDVMMPANRALHVSQTKGDGLGYNVPGCNMRFDASGKERFIEVKTTSFGKETPFFISRNEVEFLFEFRKSPRLFDLAGPEERYSGPRLLQPPTQP